ncbi:hypothetical protein EGR_05170 [Echinococcus granulosus]|uniref:Uncharacterized protein n=1 Tax=Echinococcus granulosus TaxID=6210 RepID=W6V299_ECHGR|nr:hypothetical protein EGR_05170 [Echinococcus granulosus]EUB60009.1 hypothetical protein EGR_05170 [Echinococcus granulosus]
MDGCLNGARDDVHSASVVAAAQIGGSSSSNSRGTAQPWEGAYQFKGCRQLEAAFIVISVRGYSKWEKCVPSPPLVGCGLEAMDAIDSVRVCAGAIQCVQSGGSEDPSHDDWQETVVVV